MAVFRYISPSSIWISNLLIIFKIDLIREASRKNYCPPPPPFSFVLNLCLFHDVFFLIQLSAPYYLSAPFLFRLHLYFPHFSVPAPICPSSTFSFSNPFHHLPLSLSLLHLLPFPSLILPPSFTHPSPTLQLISILRSIIFMNIHTILLYIAQQNSNHKTRFNIVSLFSSSPRTTLKPLL